MDPNATLARIVDALRGRGPSCPTPDLEDAEEALDDLIAWVAGNGFLPGVSHEALLLLLTCTRNDVTAQRREEESY